MAQLYADENFLHPVVMELRRLGHEVFTIQEAGKAGQRVPDEIILAEATAAGRAVLTHNRKDFIHLHNSHPHHEGIIVCTADLDFTGLARRIDVVVKTHSHLAGQLLRINRSSPEGS